MALSILPAQREFIMNTDFMVHIKSEPLDFCDEPLEYSNEPINLDEDKSETPHCGSTATLSLTVISDARTEYELETPDCPVCLLKISAENCCRCSRCHKIFHEQCENDMGVVSSTDQWRCSNCKNTENQRSSPFQPSIQEVVSKKSPIKVDLSIVKFEKLDWNSNSTGNESMELDPSLDSSFMDVKHKIVDKVARRFMKKMNHAARTRECTSVPRNHFGPIPGVSVGTCWRFRIQVSESGVHRPVVAGIHGRSHEGAYSIVLSGVYPDDEDNGDEFVYCGSGGRANDPTKRYSAQIADQKLNQRNRALALCCNAPIDDKNGAKAVNWRAGKPVRVVRNYRLRKRSIYAPEEGNRYDGIYKVVEYFPEVGKYNFIVWKFRLRRDDPAPAPWTDEGRRIIAKKNLARVIWPDDTDDEAELSPDEIKKELGQRQKKRSYEGYSYPDMDSCFNMKYVKSEFSASPTPVPMRRSMSLMDDFDELDIKPDVITLQEKLLKRPRRIPHRRSLNGFAKTGSNFEFTVASVMSVKHGYNTRSAAQVKQNDTNMVDANALESAISDAMTFASLPNGIKIKAEPYELPNDVRALVEKDTRNQVAWRKCKTFLKKGEMEYRNNIKDTFACRSCSKLPDRPVTTPCEHNFCLECIKDNFSNNLLSCPVCHFDLSSSFKIVENENLINILHILFPERVIRSSEIA